MLSNSLSVLLLLLLLLLIIIIIHVSPQRPNKMEPTHNGGHWSYGNWSQKTGFISLHIIIRCYFSFVYYVQFKPTHNPFTEIRDIYIWRIVKEFSSPTYMKFDVSEINQLKGVTEFVIVISTFIDLFVWNSLQKIHN